MIDFYNRAAATRTISIFNTYLGTLNPKELLILCVIAYKGECSTTYLKKVVKSSIDAPTASLVKQNLIADGGRQSKVKLWRCIAEADDATVYNNNCMFCFINVLFNIGRYNKQYKFASYERIITFLESILQMQNDKVILSGENLKSLRGTEYNKKVVLRKMEKIGFIKKITGDEYRINKRAVLLGVAE